MCTSITHARQGWRGNSSKFEKILINLKNTTTFSLSKAVKVGALLHYSLRKTKQNVNKDNFYPLN